MKSKRFLMMAAFICSLPFETSCSSSHYLTPAEFWDTASQHQAAAQWIKTTDNQGESGAMSIGGDEQYKTQLEYTKGRVYRKERLPTGDSEVTYHYDDGYSFCLSTMPKQTGNNEPSEDQFYKFAGPYIFAVLHPGGTFDKDNYNSSIDEANGIIGKLKGNGAGVSSSREDAGVKFYIYKGWLWRANIDVDSSTLCAIPIIR